ncbi:ABC transporter ATP-binding protein [Marinobacterium aestuariivivens]|uniref:Spermidine/putrescine import ATP-binding protein PotA n=1 Tax=Marinobacterium aestuariivivens TaxID=1698799 RepID=A0ABW1ZVC5_9GAMM
MLDAVSLVIENNEFFTLLGPSGCGKTTLLRAIAGFEQVDGGEIRIGGRRMNELPPYARNINTVFQSYALFPHMTVEENIGFGLEMKGVDGDARRARVREMLALVKLEQLARRRPAELSGGQQQRVALARALAPKPEVLLLDEPLSALDLKLRKEMQVELKRVQQEAGITFIFVTHDQEEALTLSDRIAVMSAGHILQVGTPTEIYERPRRRFVADFIGDINLLAGALEQGANGDALFRSDEMQIRIPCELADRVVPGRRHLAIRPENIRRVAPGEAHQLQARVENILYLGTATLYQCRTGNGTRIQVREGGSLAGPAVGDPVALSLPPQACLLLEG